MPAVLIVPGLGGSGVGHWQTHLERSFPGAIRVQQADWDRPDRIVWMEALGAAVEQHPGAVLVAHSLGCALVVHLAHARPDLKISGALLVAPADVDARPCRAAELRCFAPMPLTRLPFTSVVVASTNDPFMTISRAREVADAWGADFINVGQRGHVNIGSGFGHWPLCEELLEGLIGVRTLRGRAAS